jgi:hypothetical protein
VVATAADFLRKGDGRIGPHIDSIWKSLPELLKDSCVKTYIRIS